MCLLYIFIYPIFKFLLNSILATETDDSFAIRNVKGAKIYGKGYHTLQCRDIDKLYLKIGWSTSEFQQVEIFHV